MAQRADQRKSPGCPSQIPFRQAWTSGGLDDQRFPAVCTRIRRAVRWRAGAGRRPGASASDGLHRHDHVPEGRHAGAGLRRRAERRDGPRRLRRDQGRERDRTGRRLDLPARLGEQGLLRRRPRRAGARRQGRAHRPAPGASRPRRDGADQGRPHAPPHRPRHPDLRPAVGRAARGLAAGGPVRLEHEGGPARGDRGRRPVPVRAGDLGGAIEFRLRPARPRAHQCRRQALCRRAPGGGARPARHGRHHDEPARRRARAG